MTQIYFQVNPLNAFTITNQKDKYGTSLRGGGEEVKESKLKT